MPAGIAACRPAGQPSGLTLAELGAGRWGAQVVWVECGFNAALVCKPRGGLIGWPAPPCATPTAMTAVMVIGGRMTRGSGSRGGSQAQAEPRQNPARAPTGVGGVISRGGAHTTLDSTRTRRAEKRGRKSKNRTLSRGSSASLLRVVCWLARLPQRALAGRRPRRRPPRPRVQSHVVHCHCAWPSRPDARRLHSDLSPCVFLLTYAAFSGPRTSTVPFRAALRPLS